jgi:fructokinase
MSRLLTSMGEILIDFLPIEEDGALAGFRMHAGGAPFNVAVGMARLGQPAAFAGKVASDLFGRYLRARLEREGIDARFTLSSDAPSTLAFVAMEDGEPSYAFYGEGAADTQVTAAEWPEALFQDTAILHFGSISLLRGSTPLAVAAAVEGLRGRALLSFDPNLRPGLVRDEAAYRATLTRLFELADLVKLSAADGAWLAPGRPVEALAADLLGHGPALVLITRGGRGALALRAGEAWDAPAFAVPVVDTVGAGDAFSAGFLVALAERDVTGRAALAALPGSELRACLRFASAVSALTCARAGADPPTRDEVARFLAAQPVAP